MLGELVNLSLSAEDAKYRFGMHDGHQASHLSTLDAHKGVCVESNVNVDTCAKGAGGHGQRCRNFAGTDTTQTRDTQ